MICARACLPTRAIGGPGWPRRGFVLLEGAHPIIPVMIGRGAAGAGFARRPWTRRGVMVSAFFYPVVPKGRARIRTQMNAALTMADLDFGLQAFAEAGRETGVLS